MSFGDVGAPITPMGKAAAATLAFRVGGKLRVATVVKATFALVPEGPMALLDPEPIARVDTFRERGSLSGLLAASDLVPHRPRADVLLFGHARALLERPTPAMAVRLMIAQGSNVVLDKRLAVRGAPDPTGRTREPSPFVAMQLAWELAARTADNPVGIRETPATWAHVVDPRSRDRAAGFGPISPNWPSRRDVLPSSMAPAPGEAAFAAPVPALPPDFPWGYFNVAPEDQRIAFLRGDEWIGFEGFSAQLARVQSCLPGVRAAARVRGTPGEPPEGRPLLLEADTLVIDADRMICTVAWRGAFPVARREDLAGLHVFAGVETAQQPLVFPSSHPAHARPAAEAPGLGASPSASTARAPSVPPPPNPAAEALASTMTLATSPVQARAPVTPFDTASPARPASSIPPPLAKPEARPKQNLGATMTLDAEAIQRMLPATPFQSAAHAAAPMGAPRPASSFPPAHAQAAPPVVAAAPASPIEPRPRGLIGATTALDMSSLLRPAAAPLPFTPATASPGQQAPRTPLPAATPFEQGPLPPPPVPEGPATIDFARQAPAVPLTIGQLAASAAASAPLPRSAPVVQKAGAIEVPTTLGGFFLAAMARAGHARLDVSPRAG